jgi:hypothetical protein
MFGGHVELRSYRGVTVVAEIGLLFGEERLGTDRPMNGMATGTGHVVLGVLRAPDLGPADVFGVAGEAVVQDTLRRQLAESDDGGLAASSLYVRFSGTMAALTPGLFRRLFARRNGLVMGILIETGPNIRMTCLTNCAAYVRGCAGTRRRL